MIVQIIVIAVPVHIGPATLIVVDSKAIMVIPLVVCIASSTASKNHILKGCYRGNGHRWKLGLRLSFLRITSKEPW